MSVRKKCGHVRAGRALHESWMWMVGETDVLMGVREALMLSLVRLVEVRDRFVVDLTVNLVVNSARFDQLVNRSTNVGR